MYGSHTARKSMLPEGGVIDRYFRKVARGEARLHLGLVPQLVHLRSDAGAAPRFRSACPRSGLHLWAVAAPLLARQGGALVWFAEEPETEGRCGGLATGVYVQLAQDRGDVMVDGFPRDDQALGDLRIAESLGQQ